MGKDDRFGWPNNFNQEDEPIILDWKYFKELLLGMLAIFGFCSGIILLFVLFHLIRGF
ncbi:hypothetical protein MMG00_09925 [Ignatzschineria rhizosphaerae]|uniref:Uncharacterized protein n=1 Tax=Ignatzschineria rhizosphaerae TaxID=2923279 RepID=A0ABY3X6B2_9GAMM|nr:hypothetical protein [Ignatzschineria rhizosphaerae]UNM95538.1 hypothetical protein MMG00_09925 [Ignatzschineria rhizosphaerae]